MPSQSRTTFLQRQYRLPIQGLLFSFLSYQFLGITYQFYGLQDYHRENHTKLLIFSHPSVIYIDFLGNSTLFSKLADKKAGMHDVHPRHKLAIRIRLFRSRSLFSCCLGVFSLSRSSLLSLLGSLSSSDFCFLLCHQLSLCRVLCFLFLQAFAVSLLLVV